jgi:recombination protein RecT
MDIEKGMTVIESQAQNSLLSLLKKHERELSQVLPVHLTLNRWRWLIVNSIRKVPALAGCTPFSFLNAVMLASNLGIEIRDRSAYLVPFAGECTLMIDYRAKIDLASKAGVTIHPPVLVRENDEVFEYGWEDGRLRFRHNPGVVKRIDGKLVPVEDRGEVVAGYVMADLPTGKTEVLVMSLADIDRIRRRSRKGFPEKTFAELRHADLNSIPFKQRGPWITDPERMAEKTLVHQIFNRVPQTEQMAVSQAADDAAETEGVSVPLASGLEEIALALDPALNVPMVDGGGDTREEQKASQQAVKVRKQTAIAAAALTEEDMNAATKAALEQEGRHE